jgi:hypothetical protein
MREPAPDVEQLRQQAGTLQEALRALLPSEHMTLVERYVDISARLKEAEHLGIAPSYIFSPSLKPKDVLVSYLRWRKKPDTVDWIAKLAYEAGWNYQPKDGLESVRKSLGAAVSLHEESSQQSEVKRREMVFRKDPKTSQISLLQWDHEQPRRDVASDSAE